MVLSSLKLALTPLFPTISLLWPPFDPIPFLLSLIPSPLLLVGSLVLRHGLPHLHNFTGASLSYSSGSQGAIVLFPPPSPIEKCCCWGLSLPAGLSCKTWSRFPV